MTLQILRKQLYTELKNAFLENQRLHPQIDALQLDVDLILSHFLKKDRTWILFNRDFEVEENILNMISEAVEKRKTGMPVAYITGHKEFFGLDFEVSPDVLIPKPDTELLIEQALEAASLLAGNFKAGSDSDRFTVCDMCSGSGCVGISFADSFLKGCKIPLEVTFCDISEAALSVTEKNARRILGGKASLAFLKTNLFEKIDGTFDLILTNPPYVPHSQSEELLLDGRAEPILALDGDVKDDGSFSGSDDGLALIRRLVPQCFSHLKKDGWLLMETGEYNAEETAKLFEKAGFKEVRLERDMAGLLRNVIGRK